MNLEITESVLHRDPPEVIRKLAELKRLGVRLSIDDFGTGYSSLSMLRELPVDVLKIDKSFVDGIAREAEEWALAVAIVRLATSLHKETLAEGVESASQLAHLRTLGCRRGQGYLFAKPMPAGAMRAWWMSPSAARREPSRPGTGDSGLRGDEGVLGGSSGGGVRRSRRV